MQIKEVEGGILFVDEGYRLMPMQKADDKDYGLKALEEIRSCQLWTAEKLLAYSLAMANQCFGNHK